MPETNYFLKIRVLDQQIPYAISKPLITLGSSPEATITLPKGTADERHCRIERRDDNNYVLKDLRSTSGTFLNGSKVIEAYLKPGDLIQINDIQGEFHSNETMSGTPSPSINLRSRNSVWRAKLEALPSLARTAFPVLILGPSGSGKEMIAKTIHDLSQRSAGSILTVNCSALSESLIESELFGHVKGSYTGASYDRKGAFEAARGGTLFLDEIGDLTYNLQAKLLRALENNEVRPVGSDRIIKTDVRIIAATHQDLYSKMRDKSFRSDLFFRLNVIMLQTPSLSERMEDFDELLFRFCRDSRVKFSFQAIEWLKRHQWPGNIRELKNVVSRASALYPNTLIDLPQAQSLVDLSVPHSFTTTDAPVSLGIKSNLIKEMEKQMILNRLIANKGNQRRTANELGMPKSTLHDRIKSYNIDLDFMNGPTL